MFRVVRKLVNSPGENSSVSSWNFPWGNFMKKNPSNVYVEFHGIPWNSMKLRLMEFHGKFHGIPCHGIT
jgi:hypothetical protein